MPSVPQKTFTSLPAPPYGDAPSDMPGAASPPRRVDLVRVAAYLLFGIGAAVPVFAFMAGSLSPYTLGRWIGRMFGMLGLFGILWWLVVRRCPPALKSWAWLLLGVSVFVSGLLFPASVATGWSKEAWTGMEAIVRARNERIEELDRGLHALNLSHGLSAEGLSSTDAVNSTRAKLKRMSDILDVRRATLRKSFADLERHLTASSLGPKEMQEALRGMADGRADVQLVMDRLDAAQRSNIRAVQEVLDFVEARRHQLRVKDGQVVFDEEPHADLFNRRLQQVETSFAEVERATSEVNRLAARSHNKMGAK
ncbi:hypothetical protein QTI66_31875 [Variovorax sp. J22R133]|uniref:hypothetical protein n=1 Tax=Variovorax brevis TaxID=3053503 RepID=UPI0025770CD6|nr:hypothetical protein [Variovorax sp. J22R133]MDM0116737.1 hypothetical protein [Variovorax sp. J22R133]